MPEIIVRVATLQDTLAICAIHASQIDTWQRINQNGQLVVAPYEELSLYERWLHGGHWLSLEMGAVHLNHLLAGAGTVLVATVNGAVLAMAELYDSEEAAPFGHCLHISALCAHRDYAGQGLEEALMAYVIEIAQATRCARVTYAGTDLPEFYGRQGFKLLQSGRQVRFRTQSGRAVYQSESFTDRSPSQIRGWQMPFGRFQSARADWEALFPQDWAAGIPELTDIHLAHLKISAAGQNALIFLRETGQPGECELFCWSLRAINGPVITALRDCAASEGFETIITFAPDSNWGLLQAVEAEPTGYQQNTFELRVQA
jgi:GNAT superfamily N-acetyltransferase